MAATRNGKRGWGAEVIGLMAILCCTIGALTNGAAQEAPDPVQLGDTFPPSERADGEIADVVVFKNGYAFVRRYYSLKEGETLRIGEVPNAAFGTFFALADPAKGEVTSVMAEFVEAQREVECRDLRDIILANLGKSMRLTLKSDNPRVVTGILKKVLTHGDDEEVETAHRTTDREETVTYSTWYPHRWAYPWWEPYWASTSTTTSVVNPWNPAAAPRAAGTVHYAIQTTEGLAVVDAADVGSVLVLDENPRVDFTMKGKAKQLTVHVKRRSGGPIVIAVVYLVQGLNWTPSYRLDLTGDAEAQMTMTGIVENNLGALHGAHVRLAAGVPHFFRQEYLSPLTLENVVAAGSDSRLSSALQRQVFYGARGDVWSNNASQVAGDYASLPRGGPEAAADTMPEGANEDLFLYDCGKIDFAGGARAKILLRRSVVKYKDLYTWEINLDRAAADCYRQCSGNRQPAVEEEAQRVWHVLVLDNTGEAPWSTGVASVFRNGQMIAQERLTYTPSGSRNELRLTVATDIMNRSTEEELGRAARTRLEDGNDYVCVSGRISMVLSNLKREKVTVHVKRWVYGAVTSSGEGKSKRLSTGEFPDAWNWAYGYGGWWARFNPFSEVEWDVTLEPGESKTLTVDRDYYWR